MLQIKWILWYSLDINVRIEKFWICFLDSAESPLSCLKVKTRPLFLNLDADSESKFWSNSRCFMFQQTKDAFLILALYRVISFIWLLNYDIMDIVNILRMNCVLVHQIK